MAKLVRKAFMASMRRNDSTDIEDIDLAGREKETISVGWFNF